MFEFRDNIGDALETRKEVILVVPKLKPVSKDSKDKELEAKENKFLYKAQVTVYVARKEKYVTYKGKAFALVYG